MFIGLLFQDELNWLNSNKYRWRSCVYYMLNCFCSVL